MQKLHPLPSALELGLQKPQSSQKGALFPGLPFPHQLLRVPCACSSPWLLSWRSRTRAGGPGHGTGRGHRRPVPKPWGFHPWKPGAGLSHSVGVGLGRRPQNSLDGCGCEGLGTVLPSLSPGRILCVSLSGLSLSDLSMCTWDCAHAGVCGHMSRATMLESYWEV